MHNPARLLPLEAARTLPAAPQPSAPARPDAPRGAGRPLAIGFFGQFGCGNLGNEGSLEAMIGVLRREVPEAHLVCVAVDPEEARRQHGVEAIPIGAPAGRTGPAGALRRVLRKVLHRAANWSYALRQTGRLDLLLVPGTGILDDFSTGPWGAPYALFRWCLAARLRGTRIAFVSIGAGPIRHPLSRWFMKAAARLAHYRSYRDELSRGFMRSIGFAVGSDEVYPDIAFSLPDPQAAPPPATGGAGLTVGVGVMAYYGWANNAAEGQAIYDAYIGKITRFVRWLLERGHRVRLLTGETADARAVEDVLRQIGPEAGGRIEAEPAASLGDVMRQIAGTDLVVATRFHNVVCALKLGRPTVSLGYARKNDVLLAEMGLGAFCQPVEQLDLDRLQAQFTALVADRTAHAERVRSTVAAYRSRLRRQEEILLATVLRR